MHPSFLSQYSSPAILSLITYTSSSISLILSSKYILSHYNFNFPILLTISHMLTSCLLCFSLQQIPRAVAYLRKRKPTQFQAIVHSETDSETDTDSELDSFEFSDSDLNSSQNEKTKSPKSQFFISPLCFETLRTMFPISILFSLNILLGLYALRLVNIPTFTCLRRLNSLFIVLLEYIFFNRFPCRGIILSLLVIVLGSILIGVSDLRISPMSYVLMFLNNLCTSSLLISYKYIDRVSNATNGNDDSDIVHIPLEDIVHVPKSSDRNSNIIHIPFAALDSNNNSNSNSNHVPLDSNNSINHIHIPSLSNRNNNNNHSNHIPIPKNNSNIHIPKSIIHVPKTNRNIHIPLNALTKTYYNTLLSLPLLCILLLFSSEPERIGSCYILGNPAFIGVLVFSALVSSAVNVSTAWCASETDPLTTCVAGQCKNILVSVLGVLVEGVRVGVLFGMGLGWTVVGSIGFAYNRSC